MNKLQDLGVDLAHDTAGVDARPKREGFSCGDPPAAQTKESLVTLFRQVTVASNEALHIEPPLKACLDGVCGFTGWPIGHAFVRRVSGSAVLCSSGVWCLADPERFRAFRDVASKIRFAPGVGLPGRVLESGQPAWIRDVLMDENFPRAALVPDLVRGAFAFPVLSETRVVAVLEFFSDTPEEPDEQILDVMAQCGIQLGRVFERVEAMRSREEILKVVAHDLRTPLSTIAGNTTLLLDELADVAGTERARTFASSIGRATEHMRHLVGDLLDVAVSGTHEPELRRAPVPVSDVLAHAIELAGPAALVRDVRLTIDGTPNFSMDCDKHRIIQVLGNLIGNAIKFSPRGAEVRVSAYLQGNRPTLRVEDWGIGIHPDDTVNIFDPFWRAAGTRRPGLGLGLYIARRFVEAHGGTIRVLQPSHPGTIFEITLLGPDRAS